MTARITDFGPKYPEVEVTLTGTDGNSFALIGKVKRELQQQVGWDEAAAFADEAMRQPSYDALLRFIMATVEVS